MAQQEEGWPLGLRLLNARIALVRNSDLSGSVSFRTMLTASPPTSTDSSSDLDTQSTGSFFHDKSITLGSLIGISSILEFSRRSTRGRMVEPFKGSKRNHKLKPWLFSLCSKLTTDAVSVVNDDEDAPSLGHYLEEERKAASTASTYRRNIGSASHGPSDFSPIPDSNSPTVGGQVAPQCAASMEEESEKEANRALLEQSDGHGGAPIVLSCLCG